MIVLIFFPAETLAKSPSKMAAKDSEIRSLRNEMETLRKQLAGIAKLLLEAVVSAGFMGRAGPLVHALSVAS